MRGVPSAGALYPSDHVGQTEEYSRCRDLAENRRGHAYGRLRCSANSTRLPDRTAARPSAQPVSGDANAGKPALAELHNLAVDGGRVDIKRIGAEHLAVNLYRALPKQPAGL